MLYFFKYGPAGFADSCFALDGFFLLPLFTDLTAVLDKALECRESSPGLLGEKHERYLCAMLPPSLDS